MPDHALLNRGLGDLQRSLERFETYNDGFILPDTYIVVRLDAHRYGDWSSVPSNEYPCGSLVTKALHETAVSLMASAFRTVLAYCHGDEICLFIDPSENNSPLRRSRLVSLLASAASIHFLEASGLPATFQARISELPSLGRVVDYLYWQRRVCFRNALTVSLRSALRQRGATPENAEKQVHGLPEEQRIELLHSLGVSLDDFPSTTLRGALFWWEAEQSTEQHYRLTSATRLPDEDEDFLGLVQRIVRGKSAVSNHDIPQRTSAPISKPVPTQKAEPPKKVNRRANVSVFKV